MGTKDYLESVFIHEKQWYCPSCNRRVLGEKAPVNWPVVIIGMIITLGLALLVYLPYRMYLPKDRCPICKGILTPKPGIDPSPGLSQAFREGREKGEKWADDITERARNSTTRHAIDRPPSLLGLLLSWSFGLFFGVAGLQILVVGGLTISAISAGSSILMSLILLPPVNRFVKERWGFELSTGLKVALIVILFFMLAILEEMGVDIRTP